MSAHLGPAVTAFVDGELDHSRREEVQVHLAHCLPCRSEVEGLRRFKATLRGAAEEPQVPLDLTARLLAALTPPSPPSPSSLPSSAPPPFRLPSLLPSVPSLARRPPSRPRPAHSRLRRTAVGGAFVVLGLGGALSLAGPPPRGPVAPVDPTSPQFVLDHNTTSNELPLTEVGVVSVFRSAP